MKTLATLTVATLIVTAVATQANETKNPIIKDVENAKEFAVNNKVSQFVINEYNKTVAFQKDSWQQAKDQTANNKQQIVGIFNNIKDAFTQHFVKEGK
tara:strand:- start:4030 stop:4323 length:294 start_codon:yes stop_codon:yes gene_type:complete